MAGPKPWPNPWLMAVVASAPVKAAATATIAMKIGPRRRRAGGLGCGAPDGAGNWLLGHVHLP